MTEDNEYLINESKKVNNAIDDDFFFNIKDNAKNLQFLLDLNNKDELFYNFIKYLYNNTASKYLVAKSQDKHCANVDGIVLF